MDNIKDYDDEGFELEFEDDTPPEEKKYYVQNYTNVNLVADRRLHCTCCDMHIGTAPSSEKIIRMHPVLRVTQCIKCYRFYNSGEFEKGEDGSELYCRWCGQGGDVYCCSDCPYVFCKKCILRNLTRVALNDVLSNDNWKCFSCAPKILYHLRAQHWALVNFIEKQKQKINTMAKRLDQDEIADAMNTDSSQCCKNKRKVVDTKKRKITAVESDDESEDSSFGSRRRTKKKPPSVADDNESTSANAEKQSPKRAKVEKKPPITPQEAAVSSIEKNPHIQVKKVTATVTPPRKAPQSTSISGTSQSQPQKLPVKLPVNIQVRLPDRPSLAPAPPPPCDPDPEPDLFANLVNHSFEQTHGGAEQSENSVSSSTPSRASAPQPESITVQNTGEQIVRRVVRPHDKAPVYHNYNGYRIDLNSAAQQSTVRLPNGKIIHVKKQTPINVRSNTTQFSITPQVPPVQRLPPPRPVILSQTEHHYASRPNVRSAQYAMQPIVPTMPHPSRMGPRTRGPAPSLAPIQRMTTRPSIRANPPPMVSAPGHIPLNQAQLNMQHMMNQSMPPQIVQMPTVSAGPSMANNPNAPNIPLPRVYSNDPVGKARTQLERQVFTSIQICQQIEGKLKTLMNSNAYKNVGKLNDIKELYIHLSYLFTYTNGRFQTVHDKCMEDMTRLGFKNDASSLSRGKVININKQNKGSDEVDEGDLEIVEPNHATINLDSDDERTPEKNKSKGKTSSTRKKTPNNNNNDNSSIPLDISSSTENLECDVDITSMLQCQLNEDDPDDENGDSLLSRMNDEVGIATPPDFEEKDTPSVQCDIKLNSNVVVSLKPVEKEYPDLVKKARMKLEGDTSKDQTKPQEDLIETEEKTSEDENANEKAGSSNNNDNEEIECTDPTSSKEKSSPAEVIQIDDDLQINSNEENAIVEKDKHDDDQAIGAVDEEKHDEIEEIDGNDKTNELEETIESNKDEQQAEVDDVQPDKEKEAEVSSDEPLEIVNLDDSGETSNGSVVDTTDVPDFNENEAKSTDNQSDPGEVEAVQESHSEITSTSMASENSDEATPQVESVIETNETINDSSVSNDKSNDELENEMVNEIANELENELEDGLENDLGNELESELENVTTEMNETVENSVVVIDDTPVEITADGTITDDMITEEIITEEMVTEEIIANEVVEEIISENDSIYDLSGCNQLVSEEISDVISTSATLDVASLLETGDFENISSPESFN